LHGQRAPALAVVFEHDFSLDRLLTLDCDELFGTTICTGREVLKIRLRGIKNAPKSGTRRNP